VPLLSLRSVVFSYDGTRRVLDGISLDVRPGERVAVLGHNGSGKSTLVRILGALQAPLQGACFISGRDVREIPFSELHAKVGVVFQNPEDQLFCPTVREELSFAPTNAGFEIAQEDMRLRGFGEIDGTRQSGQQLSLRIANPALDGAMVQYTRDLAEEILAEDSTLALAKNEPLRQRLDALYHERPSWSQIS